MPVTVRKLLKILKKDGWYIVNQEGSHVQLKHPIKSGKITYRIITVISPKELKIISTNKPD